MSGLLYFKSFLILTPLRRLAGHSGLNSHSMRRKSHKNPHSIPLSLGMIREERPWGQLLRPSQPPITMAMIPVTPGHTASGDRASTIAILNSQFSPSLLNPLRLHFTTEKKLLMTDTNIKQHCTPLITSLTLHRTNKNIIYISNIYHHQYTARINISNTLRPSPLGKGGHVWHHISRWLKSNTSHKTLYEIH